MGRPPRPPEQRFWEKIQRDPATGCWNYVCLFYGRGGYANFVISHSLGHRMYAHRYAYTLLRGAIPVGLTLDHLCRNPRCCNPDHLEAVTQRENIRRGTAPTAVNAAKTHCKRGHAFTTQNTYSRGEFDRRCRTCRRNGWREERARRYA